MWRDCRQSGTHPGQWALPQTTYEGQSSASLSWCIYKTYFPLALFSVELKFLQSNAIISTPFPVLTSHCPQRPCACCQVDDSTVAVPFPLMCGEAIRYLGRTADGVVALSTYRLFVHCRRAPFLNVPLGLIEMVECRDIFHLYVYCKDAHSFR